MSLASLLPPLRLPAEVHTLLPGPTRKRERSAYCYRLTYRNPDPRAAGCALLWDVHGGREVYQVTLERAESGRLHWHCTCADAVYRGENAPHTCKHVRGLQGVGRR
jgi:hypothetical protein